MQCHRIKIYTSFVIQKWNSHKLVSRNRCSWKHPYFAFFKGCSNLHFIVKIRLFELHALILFYTIFEYKINSNYYYIIFNTLQRCIKQPLLIFSMSRHITKIKSEFIGALYQFDWFPARLTLQSNQIGFLQGICTTLAKKISIGNLIFYTQLKLTWDI